MMKKIIESIKKFIDPMKKIITPKVWCFIAVNISWLMGFGIGTYLDVRTSQLEIQILNATIDVLEENRKMLNGEILKCQLNSCGINIL